MAGTENSGGTIAFKLSEAKFLAKIDEYKKGVADGVIAAPCPSDFYSFLDYSVEEMRELMEYCSNKGSAYYGRANAAKKMVAWCRNQLNVNPFWSGKNLSKAVFLLKQDWGDGIRYSDADAKASGPAVVKVDFGGSDPRAKKARK